MNDSIDDYEHVIHPFDPLYDKQSRILILGSFPSPQSRKQQFFYGHPQNRFWRIMAKVLDEDVPCTIEEKKEMMKRNHIALYDAIYSCDIIKASDSSIRNVVPSDLSSIIEGSKISRIYCNGRKSFECFLRYQKDIIKMDAIMLPSTSPANASFTLEKLYESWKEIGDGLDAFHSKNM